VEQRETRGALAGEPPAQRVGTTFAFNLSTGRIYVMSQDKIRRVTTLFASTDLLTQPRVWQPAVDVYRTEYGWLVKYEMAGVASGDVSLTVDGSRLTVRGLRRDFSVHEGCNHYRMEISYCSFTRTIELPENLERTTLVTEFHNGMLLVRIEREMPHEF
jgi:HSP20 family protein